MKTNKLKIKKISLSSKSAFSQQGGWACIWINRSTGVVRCCDDDGNCVSGHQI